MMKSERGREMVKDFDQGALKQIAIAAENRFNWLSDAIPSHYGTPEEAENLAIDAEAFLNMANAIRRVIQ